MRGGTGLREASAVLLLVALVGKLAFLQIRGAGKGRAVLLLEGEGALLRAEERDLQAVSLCVFFSENVCVFARVFLRACALLLS